MNLIHQWCYLNGVNSCHLFCIDVRAVYTLLICNRPKRIFSNSAAYYYGHYYHIIGDIDQSIYYFKKGIKFVRCWEALLYMGIFDYITRWRRYKQMDKRAYNIVMQWAIDTGHFEVAVEIMRTVFKEERILQWSMENLIMAIYEGYIVKCLDKLERGDTSGTIGVEKYPIHIDTVNTIIVRLKHSFPNNTIRSKYIFRIDNLCKKPA